MRTWLILTMMMMLCYVICSFVLSLDNSSNSDSRTIIQITWFYYCFSNTCTHTISLFKFKFIAAYKWVHAFAPHKHLLQFTHKSIVICIMNFFGKFIIYFMSEIELAAIRCSKLSKVVLRLEKELTEQKRQETCHRINMPACEWNGTERSHSAGVCIIFGSCGVAHS